MRVVGRTIGALILLLAAAHPAEALDGRVVDGRTGAAIANAEVTIVGLTGAVKTDADGRFTWKPDPKPPFVVLVVLPGGQVARPVYVDKVDWAAVLTISVEPAVTEELTVSGVAPSIDAAPAAGMTLVSGREVQMRAPANLMQALENVPGVNQVSEGQAAVPAVRGLARGRTLILIDGARVTSERRVGPSATFLDPSSVDGIDVARGPGSVAYGSDAFGGVISVRTKRPEYTGPLRTRFSGTLGAGVPERRGEVELSKGFGSGGVIVQAHYREADDYDSPEAPVLNSGWSDRGLIVRAERRAGGGVLSAGWQGDFGRDVERPRNNSNLVRFYTPFENSHRFTAAYETSGVAGLSQLKINTFLGTNEQRTDQDRFGTSTEARRIERADISANDFQVRVTGERAVRDTKLEFGVDANGRYGLEAHDVIVSYDLAGNVSSVTDNLSTESARRTNTGLFLQAETPLAPVVVAAGGVRVDFVTSKNVGGHFGDRSISNHSGAGFAAITLGPFDSASFTAQVSRGFREPTLSDRFFRGPTGRGFITGHPDLKPETSLQFDLGVRYATGRIRLATYFYHYRITNLVERYSTAPDFFFFRNRGRARLRGIELEMQASLGRGYSLELAGQVGRGEALDDHTALDDSAPESLSIQLRKTVNDRVSAHARIAAHARDDHPGPSEVAAPGYVQLDAGTSWRLAKRVELLVSAKNLLNQKHFSSSDPRWVYAPGRSASVTAVARY